MPPFYPFLGTENCAAFSTRLSFDLNANESNEIPKPSHLNLLLLRTLFTLSSVCVLYKNAGIVLNIVLKPKPAGQKNKQNLAKSLSTELSY